MLRRGLFIFGNKSVNAGKKVCMNMLGMTPKCNFSTANLEGLKNILKSEIKHEETNYSPVDEAELKTFFNNTQFNFVDKPDSLNMELRKTQGNFEVIVNFQAKPPLPQEEQQGEGEEKSKLKNYF